MLPKDKLERLAWACEYLRAPDWLFEELKGPKDKFNFRIRVMVGGEKKLFNVIRVQYCNPHSTGARPFKGGLRFHPDVTEELLEILGFDMVKKCALANLPFGGSKGGWIVDTTKLTKAEIRDGTERIAEGFLTRNIIGPDIDVPGPDMGTNSETMFWMYNKIAELNRHRGIPNVAAIVTGKPLECDGCPGREDATATGGLIVLQEYLKISQTLFKMAPRIAIQGFGNVGFNFFKLIPETQFNIIAISDVSGGLYSPNGLNFEKVKKWHKEYGSFKGFPDAEEISNEDLLESDCDILVPAAIENQITAKNAYNIKAGAILELANEAVDSYGYKILKERRIPAIPGIVANTGGVAVSYIEWSNNRGLRPHKVDLEKILADVQTRLDKIMRDVIRTVYNKSAKEALTLDEAADIIALETLRDQLKMKHGY